MNEARGPGARRMGVATAAIAVLTVALPVAAYVGPGAGLSALGSLLALLAAVVVAIAGFLWYPIKRLLGKRRAAEKQADSGSSPADPAPQAGQRQDDETH